MNLLARGLRVAGLALGVMGCASAPAAPQPTPLLARSAQSEPLPAQRKTPAAQPDASSPLRASEVASVATDVSNGYPLLIWLARPYAANAKKLASMTKLRFYGTVQTGSLHTYVNDAQLRDIFGLKARSWTDKSAGNAIGANAHHFKIEDKRVLKPRIGALITDIELRDDPKWSLYENDEEYRPE